MHTSLSLSGLGLRWASPERRRTGNVIVFGGLALIGASSLLATYLVGRKQGFDRARAMWDAALEKAGIRYSPSLAWQTMARRALEDPPTDPELFQAWLGNAKQERYRQMYGTNPSAEPTPSISPGYSKPSSAFLEQWQAAERDRAVLELDTLTRLRNQGFKPLFQVHDSLTVEIPDDSTDELFGTFEEI